MGQTTCFVRNRALRADRAVAIVLGALAIHDARPAHADLAPLFVGKIAVDTSYVTGAPAATDIAFSGDGRALVTEKGGQILVRRPGGSVATIAYPFGGTLDTASEKGLLGVVADPDVAQNGAFYFYVSNGPTADKHRVYRAVLMANDTLTVDATPVLADSRGHGPGLEGPANHDGGGLFIFNRQLYIGVGDTGSNATPPVNKYASCLNKGNGKILRINLDGSVPSDNPLVAVASATACATPTGVWTTGAPDPRIFAWGLRNPWRLWIDSRTGLLWVGDVGESTEEEISIVAGNRHYGYPFVEGSHVWGDVDGKNCSTLDPSRPCSGPALSYTHAVGQAITGGLIPEGCGWSKVFSSPQYAFADSSASWIRVATVDSARTGLASAAMDFATYAGSAPVSFRMGPDASLYVVFNALGAVYRFSPIDRTGPDCGAQVPSSSPRSNLLLFILLGALGMVAVSVAKARTTLRAPNRR